MLEWPKDHLYQNYYRLLTLASGIKAVDECYPFTPELRQQVNERVQLIESMEDNFPIPSLEQEQHSSSVSSPSPVETVDRRPKKNGCCGSFIRFSCVMLIVFVGFCGICLWMVCSGSKSLVMEKYPVIASIYSTLPNDTCTTVASFRQYVIEWVSHNVLV